MSRFISLSSQRNGTGWLFRMVQCYNQACSKKENALGVNQVKLGFVVAQIDGVGVCKHDVSDGLRELSEQQESADVKARAKTIDTLNTEHEGFTTDGYSRIKPMQPRVQDVLKDLDDSYAITYLGVCFMNGDGFPKDKRRALGLFRHAGFTGNVEAMINYGLCEENIDTRERFECFHQAAELGNTKGMTNLGFCYSNGEGTAKDPARAFYWYQQASDAEDVDGLFNLALCYKLGEGTQQNRWKACKYYSKASKRHNPSAPVNLSLFI